MKLLKTMCPTCPFRPGSPYADLAPSLAASALSEASRICHSTGSNGIKAQTGKPSALCRGARDTQLETLAGIGFLSAPTDEAWTEMCQSMGIKQDSQLDPDSDHLAPT